MQNRLLEVNEYAFQNYMFDGSRFLDLNFHPPIKSASFTINDKFNL